jgi:hypothetical protein
MRVGPQSHPEGAADMFVDDADVLLAQPEHFAEPALHVLRSLRLVVNREAAVALPDAGRAEHLHGIVMLRRQRVFQVDAERRVLESFGGIAARLRRPRHPRAFAGRAVGLLDRLLEVGEMRLFLVSDLD